MFFTLQNTVALLALSGAASAKGLNQKRDVTNTALYAYGTNISGASVFYGDGLAYIGTTVPTWVTIATNITFTATDAYSTTVPWTISSNDTTLDSSLQLYINPTSNSFDQIGFYSSSNSSTTLPTGAVTTGFSLFGSALSYQDSAGSLEMQFSAMQTNTTDVWRLMWNAGGQGGVTVDGFAITPVTLKTSPPAVLDVTSETV